MIELIFLFTTLILVILSAGFFLGNSIFSSSYNSFKVYELGGYNMYDSLLCMTATLPEEEEYKELLKTIAPTAYKITLDNIDSTCSSVSLYFLINSFLGSFFVLIILIILSRFLKTI